MLWVSDARASQNVFPRRIWERKKAVKVGTENVVNQRIYKNHTNPFVLYAKSQKHCVK